MRCGQRHLECIQGPPDIMYRVACTATINGMDVLLQMSAWKQ